MKTEVWFVTLNGEKRDEWCKLADGYIGSYLNRPKYLESEKGMYRFSGEKIPYYPPAHSMEAYKFLYLIDGDEEVLIVCSDEIAFHDQLALAYIGLGERFPKEKLQGAGELLDGYILRWSSESFRIRTPEDLKKRITELLGV